ncbi:hypothetical protein DMH04_37315 [Kibdelosporangium aridum]|uniref:Uncharacterized protein n=1 Tax=Kibdelosporangium aridum TaxID=2030 RepID=A0A428YZ45_KIBAR|nr:hypothetical protein DMH04_37315 [Kibdelosporangium aridum]
MPIDGEACPMVAIPRNTGAAGRAHCLVSTIPSGTAMTITSAVTTKLMTRWSHTASSRTGPLMFCRSIASRSRVNAHASTAVTSTTTAIGWANIRMTVARLVSTAAVTRPPAVRERPP